MGGARFDGGAVHFPKIHIHIFTMILVFLKDNYTEPNYTTGSARQTESFRREEGERLQWSEKISWTGKLAYGEEDTNLDKCEGAKAFSPGGQHEQRS